MSDREEPREHPFIPELKDQFLKGRVDRREFLRTATLLGLSASAAYAFVGSITGERAVPRARAAKWNDSPHACS